MIKLQDYTPEVYYKQSRDFQFIGRLYDLVLNSVKTNVDMIYDIPASDSAGSKMIDLLTLTLGFKAKHTYNVKQLSAICSILPTILKNKGTLAAVKMACQAVLTAEGITQAADIIASWETPDQQDLFNIIIYIPPTLTDLALLLDLLTYILPAGISCEVYRAIKIDTPTPKTVSKSTDIIQKYTKVKEYNEEIVGVSMVTRGKEDLYNNELGYFNEYTNNGELVPDSNFKGPITNSTVIRGNNQTNTQQNTNTDANNIEGD